MPVSIITFAEVYEGIYYGHDRSQHEIGFRNFLRTISVLDITRSLARHFALLRGQLRATPQGKSLIHPKDNYDLFIAATALYHHLTLVTRNRKDFDRIPDLKLYQATSPSTTEIKSAC